MRAIQTLAAAGMALLACAADKPAPAAIRAQAVGAGVWLLPGGFPPKREPDGNTVIFAALKGLIVLDTGRHPWHTQAIIDFARARGQPVAAIVNSHWHLDHTTGNAALKRAYPAARVYASRAVESALKGFLLGSAADSRAYLQSQKVDPETAEDLRGDIAAIADPAALIPDVPIERSQRLSVAGRRLELHLARNAATAGDVWIYDPATRVAAVGDLITLPSALLDTACPEGWRKALAEIWATPFLTAIPGHGPALTRARFASYRAAFDDLIDCAKGAPTPDACAEAWVSKVRPLLEPGELASRRASAMTADYVGMLRAHGGRSAFCEEPG